MLIVGNHHLFADAKVFKDISQNLVGGDFTGNFTEVMQAFADVLGDCLVG